jgi:hypothetical protein
VNRTKIVFISSIAIAIIALASVGAYFYVRSQSDLKELHKSRVYEAYLAAYDVSRKLGWFTGLYYDNIYEMDALLRPENSYYNESNVRVIEWKCDLLDYCAERFWIDVREDFSELRRLAYYDKEIPFFNTTAYNTVHGVIYEALGQVGWAMMGKGEAGILNETSAFLWELYYVIGIDQVVTEQPKSKLEGLTWCFNELESYWWAESQLEKGNLPTYLTQPQIALEWAVANATSLHQELAQWDKYHTPLLPN